jgi:ribosomal protein RSM22 (predicted rRNA methylase)
MRNFTVTRRVLEEVKLLLGGEFEPKNALDFGAGAGASSVAALRTFGGSLQNVHGVDSSRAQREAFQILVGEIAKSPLEPAPDRSEPAPSAPVSVSASPVFTKRKGASGHDLVVLSYVCHEQPKSSMVLRLVRELYEVLEENGVLVIVEPGTPLGFRNITLARKMLLNLNAKKAGHNPKGWGGGTDGQYYM